MTDDVRDTWRPGWDDELRGAGCVLCPMRDVDADDYGVRVFTGRYLDAFLSTRGRIPGYTVAVWNGGHVAEPTELSDEQAAGYWLEVLTVVPGRATRLQAAVHLVLLAAFLFLAVNP